jgi:hypothetical protein
VPFFVRLLIFFCSVIVLMQMEPADPDFYRIGYARMMRAYGIEFLEGPDGMGVYASRDVEPLRRARVSHFSSRQSLNDV